MSTRRRASRWACRVPWVVEGRLSRWQAQTPSSSPSLSPCWCGRGHGAGPGAQGGTLRGCLLLQAGYRL